MRAFKKNTIRSPADIASLEVPEKKTYTKGLSDEN